MEASNKPKRFLTRRRFLAAAATGVGGTLLYTWRVEPHWLEVVHRPLPIRNLPAHLDGTTLAQLSDLHIGPKVDDAYVTHVFDLIRGFSPEIVVYTGDWISHHPQFREQTSRVLARLVRGTMGTVGILGNHDYGPGWQDFECARHVASIAEEAGCRILRNELIDIQGLNIVGLDDLWARRFDPDNVLSQLNEATPALALVHNPDAVDRKGWEGYSGWILAGHTHGGQCKPPFLPPPLLPVQNRRYTCGEFELSGGRQLYISRGVGHLLRVRFNVRPEVTLFRLVSTKAALDTRE